MADVDKLTGKNLFWNFKGRHLFLREVGCLLRDLGFGFGTCAGKTSNLFKGGSNHMLGPVYHWFIYYSDIDSYSHEYIKGALAHWTSSLHDRTGRV